MRGEKFSDFWTILDKKVLFHGNKKIFEILYKKLLSLK